MEKSHDPEHLMLAMIGRLERELNLDKGFHDSLFQEDDWSFIIKVSALIENACTHCLADRFEYPSQKRKTIEGLNQSLRITMLYDLDLINVKKEKVLGNLSSLRNDLAHESKYATYDLKRYFHHENHDGKRSSWVTCVFANDKEKIEYQGTYYTPTQYFLAFPKLCIWKATLHILSSFNFHIEHRVFQKSVTEAQAQACLPKTIEFSSPKQDTLCVNLNPYTPRVRRTTSTGSCISFSGKMPTRFMARNAGL